MKGRYGIAMNIYGKILPGTKQINRLVALSREAKQRLSWMDWYNSHNRNARLTCRRFGISPDTFYRWRNRYNPGDLSTLEDDRTTRTPKRLRKPQTDPSLVLRTKELRETYPRWGKKKIWKLLGREGWNVSVSTVGRTIDRLRARGILNEPAIVTARLAGQKRRRKNKRPYAIPRDWNYQVILPGDLVQIDTVHVSLPWGQTRYQFTANDYIGKHTARCAASSISSKAAKRILDTIEERFPHKIKAIQIDGGSEFKAEFERECQKRNIILFVLPVKSPKLNGVVERMQRTSREEIYDIKPMPLTLDEHNQLLEKEDYIYNYIRPHDALDLLTPNEYYLTTLAT
jgi:transposase InsO family protein